MTNLNNNIRAFFASGFFFGYFPFASGTIGTIPAFLIHISLINFLNTKYLIYCYPLIFLFFFIIAILTSNWAMKFWQNKDPKQFVIDEIAGYLTIPIFFPFSNSLNFAILSFFVFRFFDVFKPPIARHFDKKTGGIYIVLDDIVSGLYSALTIFLLQYFQVVKF